MHALQETWEFRVRFSIGKSATVSHGWEGDGAPGLPACSDTVPKTSRPRCVHGPPHPLASHSVPHPPATTGLHSRSLPTIQSPTPSTPWPIVPACSRKDRAVPAPAASRRHATDRQSQPAVLASGHGGIAVAAAVYRNAELHA